MDRLPDVMVDMVVMVDDHKLAGRCFQDANGDLRDQARERPRPPARPAVQHTQIVEKRGDANRLGFALQLTTVRFVGTFLDDPTAVPPAVLATMSRQLGIDTTTDLTGYRDGKWRFAHAAQIRTEHGYRDLADRAAGFGLTRWLYAQCWTGTADGGR